MADHSRDKRVTFARPFELEGLNGSMPPGTYSVETRQDRSGLLSLFANNRTSLWMRICRNPGVSGLIEHLKIEPRDLAAALARDALTERPSERTTVTTERRALAPEHAAANLRSVSHGVTQSNAKRSDRPR